METIITLTFGVASRTVVVGYDPEGADFDRPRGEVVGEVYYVVARSTEGRVFEHAHSFKSHCGVDPEALAEKLASRIAAASRAGRDLDEQFWNEGRPEYGSLAYQRDEEGLVEQDRQAERDNEHNTSAFGY